MEEENIIQCYSPDVYHDPQALVINEKARKSLIKALQDGKEKTVIDAMTTDGEGYYFTLIINNAEKIDKEYMLPYGKRYALGDVTGTKDPRWEGYVLKGIVKENKPFTQQQNDEWD